MDFEDYYEPSEFDEKVEEFKDYLRDSVKEEVKSEIERLRKENQELRDIRDNWKELEKEHNNKIAELEREKYQCKTEASRKRLEELFNDVGMNTILYQPYSKSVYLPKCDKCDEQRNIHFISPSGKDITESCECDKSFSKYYPKQFVMCEFRRNSNGWETKKMSFWFKSYREDSDYDGYTDSKNLKGVYNGESFEDLFEKFGSYSSGLFFRNEEDCQKYCDWLSEKAGVTADMVEDRYVNTKARMPRK